MGADLYIRSLYHYDEAKGSFVGSEVQGYFRDSYNSTSVMQTLGLSWWVDIGPRLDEEGMLQPQEIARLKQTILDNPQKLPTREELIADYAEVDNGENSVEAWHTYYREKRERFLAFLDRALTLNESIYCSI